MVGPNANGRCPCKRRGDDTETPREPMVRMKPSSGEESRGPAFCASAPRANGKGMHFWCFKPPSVWLFVLEALGSSAVTP